MPPADYLRKYSGLKTMLKILRYFCYFHLMFLYVILSILLRVKDSIFSSKQYVYFIIETRIILYIRMTESFFSAPIEERAFFKYFCNI